MLGRGLSGPADDQPQSQVPCGMPPGGVRRTSSCPLPAGKLTTFNGSFIVDDFARFLNVHDVDRFGGDADYFRPRFLADPSSRIFEYAPSWSCFRRLA